MTDVYADLTLSSILASVDGHVLTITFNRPESLNPVDTATLQELNLVFDRMEQDPATEIVVLRGNGRAFSAGGDLKRHLMIHQDAAQIGSMARLARKTVERIDRADQLFIAVVDGLAVAGGVEFMLHCDIVIASHEAAFSDGHLNISLLPGAGGSQIMPRMINPLRAKLFMLTADFIDGQRAAEIGLISAAYPRDELETEMSKLLDNLLSKSFSARTAIKYLVNQSMQTSLDVGMLLEGGVVEHFETTHPDAHEGLLAFTEKRKPAYSRTARAV